MQDTDPMQKTIVFCERVEHAERLRQALVNANPEEANRNRRYVARITGDNPESKQELENFTNPESPYPVIVTTSKLLTTGVDVQTCKLIVLDSTINSISEFKQIIGRGTRLNEEYGKYYFAIMDFRGATRHFSDPEFDGNPFKEREEIHLSDPESVESMQGELEEETVAPEELKENNPEEEILIDPTHTEESKPLKPVVEGVDFNVATRMVQYIDPESGKLIAESIADYSRKKLQEKFESLDTFLSTWNQSQRKDVIIDELKEKGIPVEELKKDIGLNIDEFDLILHVAFNQKPLTRSERAKKVKQDHILSTYQGQARQILETLLDKYAEEGSLAIDDIGDLEVQPFTQYGTPVEIVNDLFGGKQNYLKALKELQKELYEVTV
jgi:type I restriction enzyme R subunit